MKQIEGQTLLSIQQYFPTDCLRMAKKSQGMMNLLIEDISEKVRKGIMDYDLNSSSLEMRNQAQPLFTLTAEEVEEMRQTIVYALDKRTDWIIANAHKLDDYERSVLERLNERDKKNLKKIYEYQGVRIKQWQNGNKGEQND